MKLVQKLCNPLEEFVFPLFQSLFKPMQTESHPYPNDGLVHVEIVQRTPSKSITIVDGLQSDSLALDLLKYVKQTFRCNGTIVKNDPSLRTVVQFSGDQRIQVVQYLTEEKGIQRESIQGSWI